MMKNLFVLTIAMIFFIACGSNKQQSGHIAVQEYFAKKIDTLISSLESLKLAAEKQSNAGNLKLMFGESRSNYKEIESIVEYYFQGLAKRINGPVLPDVKTDDNQVFPPHGFQVLEQTIWSLAINDTINKSFIDEINILTTDLKFIRTQIKDQTILARHVREMVHHQLIRIATNGLTGLDAPVSFASMPEAAAALRGLRDLVGVYIEGEKLAYQNKQQISQQFAASINFLEQNKDFDSFNRLLFIKRHLMPLSVSLRDLPAKENADDKLIQKAFTGTLNDLMQGNGLNPDFYTPYAEAASNENKVKLGKFLFYDVRLSKSSTISCASCHKPEIFFTDGLKKASNFAHGGTLARNTPTLYYAALQASQFYDQRTSTLEEQIHDVMENSEEFNLADEALISKISSINEYKQLSKLAFKSDSLDNFKIRNAIGSYVRSLQPFSSHFDDYMKGKDDALNAEEIAGFNLFMGKAKCGTCHFAPVFNGTIPPWFTKSESEIIGIPEKAVWENAKIDPDPGRYAINQLEELKYAFKTPTVRNTAKTAPYMHNGVYKTLDEVVNFYHKGGGLGIGIDLPFQSLPFDSLQLNNNEKKSIVAFMNALTDRTDK
jgi:cytochrome c peroxidase